MKLQFESRGRTSGRSTTILFFYAFLVLGWACDSFAAPPNKPVFIYGAYASGNQYRAKQPIERLNYVAGILDGFIYAPAWGADEKNLDALRACMDGMPGSQLLAIVDQYVESKPSNWDHPMPVLVHQAMFFACKDRNQPLH